MKRGDLVTVAIPGDYGKPRPALVIQSDALPETGSVLVCLLTTDLKDAPLYRFSLSPASTPGLREPSQVMIEKIMAVRRDKCGQHVGRVDDVTLFAIGRQISFVIGLAD